VIIKNEELLEQFRQKRICEGCGRPLRFKAEPHHTCVTRGFGGGTRLDIAINLTALGNVWECGCHDKTTKGKPPMRSKLLQVIAEREGCTVAYIVEECARILALDKHAALLDTVEL